MGRDKEKHKKSNASWKARNRQHVRDYQRSWSYNITLDELHELEKLHRGLCGLCGDKPSIKGKDNRTHSLHVDHDHQTGKVRGLLCQKCNLALGYLRDSPDLAEKAAAYLRRYAP